MGDTAMRTHMTAIGRRLAIFGSAVAAAAAGQGAAIAEAATRHLDADLISAADAVVAAQTAHLNADYSGWSDFTAGRDRTVQRQVEHLRVLADTRAHTETGRTARARAVALWHSDPVGRPTTGTHWLWTRRLDEAVGRDYATVFAAAGHEVAL